MKNLSFLGALFVLLTNAFSQDFSGFNINDLQKMMNSSSMGGATGISMSKGASNVKQESEYFQDPSFVKERVIDKAINPEEYILGPGDVLFIYIWGAVENKYDLIINAENKIVIPHIGEYDVQNKSLKTFRDDVKIHLQKEYKNVEISISLKEMKTFKTYIFGEVSEPGSYIVNNSTKISDLISLASGTTDSASQLGIEIKNIDLGNTSADLNLSKEKGAYVNDPYIRLGDIVYVKKATEFISIYGAVKEPGRYDVISNYSLRSLINMAGGFDRGADSLEIFVYRFVDDYDSLFMQKVINSEIDNFLIYPDDRIIVNKKPDYRIHREIEVAGEVKYPGIYPIQENKTTLGEAIEMAGGFTDNAFLKGSTITRKKVSKLVDREFERLKTQPVITLSPNERSYLKTKLTEQEGLISINFSEFENARELVVREGDRIIIAEKSLSIRVTGAVTQPGLVSYSREKDFKHYIAQAGGYNTRAKKRSVMIIKAGTNTWLKPREVEEIEAGDAIYVSEKQYVEKFLVIKDIFLMLGSIAAVIMSGIAVSNAIQDSKTN